MVLRIVFKFKAVLFLNWERTNCSKQWYVCALLHGVCVSRLCVYNSTLCKSTVLKNKSSGVIVHAHCFIQNVKQNVSGLFTCLYIFTSHSQPLKENCFERMVNTYEGDQ